MNVYFRLLRVHHYIKNILIFLPLIFSRNLFNTTSLRTTLIGFLSFSILSSVVYIFNDIKDIESDRNHPYKKNRPLASGAISIKNSILIAIALILISFILILSVKDNLIHILILMGSYFVLNIFYSIKLKHLPLWDIIILASGFLLRVLIGGQLSDVSVSYWLYMCVISMSFYLGLSKRRNELKNYLASSREVLKHYSIDFLDKHMYMFLTIGIVFYSLWVLGYKDSNNLLIWTIPLVMIVSMKYNLSAEKNSSEDPIEILFSDKSLLALVLFYALVVILIIYLKG